MVDVGSMDDDLLIKEVKRWATSNSERNKRLTEAQELLGGHFYYEDSFRRLLEACEWYKSGKRGIVLPFKEWDDPKHETPGFFVKKDEC